MNVQNINLDLSKAIMAGQIIRMGQGDNDGTTIRATILDNSAVISLSGMSATFCMRLPDGVHYVRDTNCTISGNVITYVVDEEHCCAVAGYTDEAYFEVVSGSTEYSTSRFRVKVERSAIDGATPAESWDTEVDELIERGEQAVSDANQALADANASIQIAHDAGVAAAEEAASEVEGRVQAAIDAMGDISELAVPLMSPDVRGGAKLEEHGGLALRDGALGIGSLVQESDGYARGGLAQVTAKGHAEQVSTTGKNLLVPDNRTSKTINGVTLTVNADESITANGTATATVWYKLNNGVSIDSAGFLSGCPNGGSTASYALVLGKTGEASKYDFGSGLSVPSGDYTNVYLYINSGVTVSNLTFYPMLELGSTATAYEPYTGGAPSPSPNYAQEIQVVRGRNLWDDSAARRNSWVDGTSGLISRDTNSELIELDIQGGESYTLSSELIGQAGSTYRVSFFSGTPSSDTLISIINGSGANTFTFSAPQNAKKAYIGIFRGMINCKNIQLTLGSTPQPYVPYGHVGMEVHSSKNLFRGNNVRMETPIPRGTILVASSATADRIYLHGANGEQLDYWSLNKTAQDGRRYRAFSLISDTYSFSGFGSEAQLEFGTDTDSVPTEYEPNLLSITPIPLPQRGWVAGLPDGTADSLRLDGAGKCEWTLPTSEMVLDGSERWYFNTTGGKSFAYSVLQNSADIEAQTSLSKLLVDKFIVSLAQTGETAYQGGHNLIIFTGDTYNPTSAAEAKAWAASNPITVLYPLATPVNEDCGYVEDWPTDIPEGTTVTIPELDEVGISYFVDSSVTELAKQWYARANSEYEDRLQALEAAVAELVTGA